MAVNQGCVLLVPHPQFERAPERTRRQQFRCLWPPAEEDHRRKYVRTSATYLRDLDGDPETGVVKVWCEHEAPTLAAPSRHPAVQWVQEVDVHSIDAEKADPRTLLNSDPWIWTPGFVWSVCQQYGSEADRQRGALRDIAKVTKGDVVVFGSSVNGKWRMDTVLAVSIRVDIGDLVRRFGARGSYATCVGNTLEGHGLFSPVRGRPFRRGLRAPFSFAPVDADGRVRQRVDITGLLRLLEKSTGGQPSPANSAGLARCTVRRGTVQEFWNLLVKRALSTNHALGVRFSHPLDVRRIGVAGQPSRG